MQRLSGTGAILGPGADGRQWDQGHDLGAGMVPQSCSATGKDYAAYFEVERFVQALFSLGSLRLGCIADLRCHRVLSMRAQAAGVQTETQTLEAT